MKREDTGKKKTTASKKKKSSKKKTFFRDKKFLALSITAFLFLVMAFSFVFAETNITGQVAFLEEVQGVANDIKEIVTPFFQALFGGGEDLYTNKGVLFTQILFFLIIFGIILLALKKVDFFSDNPLVLNIMALAVSLLAIRGISSIDLITAILLPSEALGIALLAGIPFVIYFIIVNVAVFNTQPAIVRRIAWIFFAIIFIGLWVASRPEEVVEGAFNLYNVYLFTGFAAIIMAWIDGTIRKFFLKIEADKLDNTNKIKSIAEYKKRLGDAKANEYVTDTERKELVDHYEKVLKRLSRRK